MAKKSFEVLEGVGGKDPGFLLDRSKSPIRRLKLLHLKTPPRSERISHLSVCRDGGDQHSVVLPTRTNEEIRKGSNYYSSDLRGHQENVAGVVDQLMLDYRGAACDLEAVALVEPNRSLVFLED